MFSDSNTPSGNKKSGYSRWWVYALIAIPLIVMYILVDSKTVTEVGWTEFQHLAKEDVFLKIEVLIKKNILEATVKNNQKHVVFKENLDQLGSNPKVFVKIPSPDKFSEFYDKVREESAISAHVSYKEGEDFFDRLLNFDGGVLIFIILLACYCFIPLMRAGKLKDKIFAKENKNKDTLKDVNGLEEVKQDVEDILTPICPKCRKTFPTGIIFCSEDGSKLVSPDKMIPWCVKCRKEYTDGTNFCPIDGGIVLTESSGYFSKENENDYEYSYSYNESEHTYFNGTSNFNKKTLFSLGLLISFFLPWINYLFWKFSAFEIPIKLDFSAYFFEGLANFLGVSGFSMTYLKITYLLYLIPCCSIYNIIVDLSRNKKSYFLNEYWVGLTFTAPLFVLAMVTNTSIAIFGIGYYLTAIFSVLGLLYNNRKK